MPCNIYLKKFHHLKPIQLYSEGKLYSIKTSFLTNISCIHIETANLSDGLYELIPADEIVADVNSVNLTELNQDPDQRPEEPKAIFGSAQEGKPRCIIPLFPPIFTFTYYIYLL